MFGAAVFKLPYSIAGNFPVRTVKIGPLENFPLYGIQIQARKCYIESLSLVLKDKRSCLSQSERSAVQLPLDRALALRK